MDDNKKPISERDLEVLSIDTPNDDQLDQAEPSVVRKKRRKGPVVLIIILAILIVSGAGLAVYLLFFQQKPTTTTNETTNNTTQSSTSPDAAKDYASDIIAKIRIAEEALAVTFPKLKVEASNDNSPALKYGTNKYYIAGNFGSALYVSDTSNTNSQDNFRIATQAVAIKILDSEKNLVKSSSKYSHIYKSTDVVCVVSTEAYPTYVVCANTIDYKTVAATIAPFGSAFIASAEGANTQGNAIMHTPKVTKKSDGYANAILPIGLYEGMGGYAGLFFSKDGTAWTYWKGAQGELACGDYNTYDLQKAFEGDSCYDELAEINSTVKVTLSN